MRLKILLYSFFIIPLTMKCNNSNSINVIKLTLDTTLTEKRNSVLLTFENSSDTNRFLLIDNIRSFVNQGEDYKLVNGINNCIYPSTTIFNERNEEMLYVSYDYGLLNESRPFKDYFDPQDCNRAKWALGQKVYNDFINLNFLVKIPKKSKVKLKIPFIYKIEDCTSKEVYKFLENHKYYFEVTYQMDKELISSFFPKQLDSMAKQGYYPYYNKIRSNRTQLNVEGNLWHIVK